MLYIWAEDSFFFFRPRCPAFVSNDLISPKFALELALFSFPSAGDVMDFKIPDASAGVVASLSALCFVMYCGLCFGLGWQTAIMVGQTDIVWFGYFKTFFTS